MHTYLVSDPSWDDMILTVTEHAPDTLHVAADEGDVNTRRGIEAAVENRGIRALELTESRRVVARVWTAWTIPTILRVNSSITHLNTGPYPMDDSDLEALSSYLVVQTHMRYLNFPKIDRATWGGIVGFVTALARVPSVRSLIMKTSMTWPADRMRDLVRASAHTQLHTFNLGVYSQPTWVQRILRLKDGDEILTGMSRFQENLVVEPHPTDADDEPSKRIGKSPRVLARRSCTSARPASECMVVTTSHPMRRLWIFDCVLSELTVSEDIRRYLTDKRDVLPETIELIYVTMRDGCIPAVIGRCARLRRLEMIGCNISW